MVQLNKLYGDRLLKNLQDASAEKYYTIAINLYNEYSIENISLLEKLYFSKIKACQLGGEFNKALKTVGLVEKNIKNNLSLQKALLKKLDILTVNSKYSDVLTIGVNTLNSNHQPIKKAPSTLLTIKLIFKSLILLRINLNKLHSMEEKKTSRIYSTQEFIAT